MAEAPGNPHKINILPRLILKTSLSRKTCEFHTDAIKEQPYIIELPGAATSVCPGRSTGVLPRLLLGGRKSRSEVRFRVETVAFMGLIRARYEILIYGVYLQVSHCCRQTNSPRENSV
ncbi:hypothetical protein Zmor_022810 [Zophobas morio]|uniref:Uncharacterized protein n=1 Tax=Zophobas morio TaxID=2755281 RepID=A0AA38HWU4_9CUCU|nr:hypothetical protein Zmor_022810 [Zophobas morio]